MEDTNKDLLQLERKHTSISGSAIESLLLVRKNKDPSPLTSVPSIDKKPEISSVPRSQVLGKLKDFLGVFAESNKKLEMEAKGNAEAYNIEALTGHESEVVEMDLMLGVADLHTSEAVEAAEAAISGNQPVVYLAGGDSDTESDDSSDESDEEEDDESICLAENIATKTRKDESSSEAAEKRGPNKRAKIVELG